MNNAESRIVKLQNELKAKESAISDLQLGGTGMNIFGQHENIAKYVEL